MALLLALDQGTTSTRAMLFDEAGRVRAQASRPLAQHFPADGWVEHDAEEIWDAAVAVMAEALVQAGVGVGSITALGIANQRETVVLWERASGRPLAKAIVWQDRRTADACAAFSLRGLDAMVQERTGLLLDPYFSATKIAWLLEHIPGARQRAERGELAAGTIDSWLLWRLSGGSLHATDATNASRTLLFDLERQCWDHELLWLFGIPAPLLPTVRDCAGTFTRTHCLGGSIAVTGIAGDQQAAAIGQGCLEPGAVKATFGTGCFVLAHAGTQRPRSRHRLLATLAWRLGGEARYALEGAVFQAGAVVQWLRDGLQAIPDAAASEAIARTADPASGVQLVPAFTGLGAPYWDPQARGAILGLTRATTLADIVHAGLSSVAFQVRDLLEAMAQDGVRPATLRVDGGMTANDLFMGMLADQAGVTVERPQVTETTARGAALLAGLGAGVHGSLAEAAASWRLDRRFSPAIAADERERRHAAWKAAVARVRSTDAAG
jgi:glycerol kinase